MILPSRQGVRHSTLTAVLAGSNPAWAVSNILQLTSCMFNDNLRNKTKKKTRILSAKHVYSVCKNHF